MQDKDQYTLSFSEAIQACEQGFVVQSTNPTFSFMHQNVDGAIVEWGSIMTTPTKVICSSDRVQNTRYRKIGNLKNEMKKAKELIK